TYLYTLSLHDALPISPSWCGDQTGLAYSSTGLTKTLKAQIKISLSPDVNNFFKRATLWFAALTIWLQWVPNFKSGVNHTPKSLRSEEHTSELQSRGHL